MKKEELISKIDLAVVTTIFIGISYALTYLFYAGKFYFYGIPIDFLEVDAIDVFSTMLTLSPLIIYLFWGVKAELKNRDGVPKNASSITIRLKNVKKMMGKIKADIEINNIEADELGK
ncbi:hypothetical protein AB1K89_03465 [Sporosarcina sp. 179-K 8C2 HS]|uniref:hypothetical protein n=1 Tax=Sporosarcina sp. 179-K 8C2 HS TaxID=3142387 RepID=UPI0039A17000